MKTSRSTVAAAAMLATSMTFAATAAGPIQDRIPELQRTGANSATLTGCVARGTATATYTLTNITKEGHATARDAVQRMTVVLSATDVDLSKHVGHMVSVTGPYTSTERVTGTAGTGKPEVADGVKDGKKRTTGTLAVRSLTMIADSCSQPADD